MRENQNQLEALPVAVGSGAEPKRNPTGLAPVWAAGVAREGKEGKTAAPEAVGCILPAGQANWQSGLTGVLGTLAPTRSATRSATGSAGGEMTAGWGLRAPLWELSGQGGRDHALSADRS
jgi:hypothetical protein